MKKIKKGDKVIVIAGKDKGKTGTILSVVKGGGKFIIDDINLAKKNVKPDPNANQQGGIVPKPMPIDASNVMLYDPVAKKGSRVGIRILEDGRKVRYFKSSDQVVDVQS